jgi:UDP-glucose 4-epimerase
MPCPQGSSIGASLKNEGPASDGLDLPSGAAILVTGGAGFIGSSICHRLAGRGLHIRVLDDLSTGRMENLEGIEAELEFIEGDLGELDLVRLAMKGVDFVLHQGALPSVPRSIDDPLASHTANATGTLNVLIAARSAGVKRVVYASSSSVYGNNAEVPKREDMIPAPISPYAASKLAGEHYCRTFHALHGLEVVTLRYFNVFGPRQNPYSAYAAVIPKFINAVFTRKPATVFGDGEQSRDFTYVDDVVRANLQALTAPQAPGRVLNIACHRSTTLNQLLKLLEELMGIQAVPRHVPARRGDLRHSLADISLAGEVLAYEPAVSIEEGLRRTVGYWDAVLSSDA